MNFSFAASRSLSQLGSFREYVEPLQPRVVLWFVRRHAKAPLAGCTQVEHGVFATPEVLALLAERGTYFDPQCELVFRNYLDNKPWFEGIGNYNAAGFAAMAWKPGVAAIARDVDVFCIRGKRACDGGQMRLDDAGRPLRAMQRRLGDGYARQRFEPWSDTVESAA